MGIHVRVLRPARFGPGRQWQRYAFTWLVLKLGRRGRRELWAKHVCLMAFPPWPAFSLA
jgi:hypothetical protein